MSYETREITETIYRVLKEIPHLHYWGKNVVTFHLKIVRFSLSESEWNRKRENEMGMFIGVLLYLRGEFRN